MSYTHHPLLGRTDIDEAILADEARESSDAELGAAELEFLIARLNRIAADRVRSRQYRRRSNIGATGFRRNQRRGATS
ncbi:MAG: hypothetical protein ACK4SZ_04000 [Allosphingosinicella sp.]|uniref:hypothetical protein n=1 Tax=Allosphingosinicella sp. TaxID=2823234 RepID=UPI003961F802